jgi:hypothetical protein
MEKLDKKLRDCEFEKGLPPDSAHNIIVAERLGLIYDPREQVYKDNDGCPVRDRYGQHLG